MKRIAVVHAILYTWANKELAIPLVRAARAPGSNITWCNKRGRKDPVEVSWAVRMLVTIFFFFFLLFCNLIGR